MTAYILVTAGLLGGGTLLLILAALIFDAAEVAAFIIGIVAVLAILGGLMVGIMTPAEQAYGHSACDGYSRNTGRVTKFVTTTSLDTGTCMTKDSNGRWIATDNLREVVQQP